MILAFIAPKLNSAGRMDDASIALEFLLSETSHNANETLSLLDELNNYRKTLQEEISKKLIPKQIKMIRLLLFGENWHEGVIGIVASKLSNSHKNLHLFFQFIMGSKRKCKS